MNTTIPSITIYYRLLRRNLRRRIRHLSHRYCNRMHRHRLYVTVDPSDSSVTLSPSLLRHMQLMRLSRAAVMLFYVPSLHSYAFTLNPPIKRDDLPLSPIQLSEAHHCIGFCAGEPTVHRILYEYGLPATAVCRLTVNIREAAGALIYYQLCPPHHEHINRQ